MTDSRPNEYTQMVHVGIIDPVSSAQTISVRRCALFARVIDATKVRDLTSASDTKLDAPEPYLDWIETQNRLYESVLTPDNITDFVAALSSALSGIANSADADLSDTIGAPGTIIGAAGLFSDVGKFVKSQVKKAGKGVKAVVKKMKEIEPVVGPMLDVVAPGQRQTLKTMMNAASDLSDGKLTLRRADLNRAIGELPISQAMKDAIRMSLNETSDGRDITFRPSSLRV